MAFGSTLTLTINAVAKVLNKINQDNYGSEYYLRSATDEYRVRIRHSKEAPLPDGRRFDRHNIEVTWTVYATPTTAEIVRQCYSITRVLSNDDLTSAQYLMKGATSYMDGNTVQADLLTWQS